MLRTSLILCAAAAVAAAGIALPASADDTATTFTLTGGDVTLSVEATAALAPQASS